MLTMATPISFEDHWSFIETISDITLTEAHVAQYLEQSMKM